MEWINDEFKWNAYSIIHALPPRDQGGKNKILQTGNSISEFIPTDQNKGKNELDPEIIRQGVREE